MNLSPHFTLEELTASETALRKGIPNAPDANAVRRLTVLAERLLEPARAMLGVPLRINSGFRSSALNRAVGGAKNSAHLTGDAVDFVPVGMPLLEAFDALRGSNLPFDQIIHECSAWIHLAHARQGAMPRREALLASGGPGAWRYVPAPSLHKPESD